MKPKYERNMCVECRQYFIGSDKFKKHMLICQKKNIVQFVRKYSGQQKTIRGISQIVLQKATSVKFVKRHFQETVIVYTMKRNMWFRKYFLVKNVAVFFSQVSCWKFIQENANSFCFTIFFLCWKIEGDEQLFFLYNFFMCW